MKALMLGLVILGFLHLAGVVRDWIGMLRP